MFNKKIYVLNYEETAWLGSGNNVNGVTIHDYECYGSYKKAKKAFMDRALEIKKGYTGAFSVGKENYICEGYTLDEMWDRMNISWSRKDDGHLASQNLCIRIKDIH